MMDQHPLPVLTPSPIDPGSIDGEKATSYARGVLDRLNAPLAANDAEALESCFYADQAYWKDQLALTWLLRTFRCPGTIAASFLETAAVFLPATPALDAMNFKTDVFIIGAGNAVMADRNAHPGDNWARRYDCMRFHIPTAFYRATAYDEELRSPHLLTRQDLASQVRRYVDSFNLNTLQSAEIQWTEYDELAKKWTIAHLVLATGIGSQKPNMPYIAEPHIYKGISVHSAEYKNAKLLKEQGVKSVVVIGSANTAFDVLEDCHSAGLDATMVARSPTYIVPLEYVCHQASLDTYDTGLNRNDTPQSRQPGSLTCLDADAIIWCTGFADSNVVTTATEILGGKSDVTVANTKIDDQTGRAHVLTPGDVASRLDATWRVDEEGEIRGMWKRHSHAESIWIMGAALEGILPPAYGHGPAPKK
ncbi:hypothetical protein BDV09DRAFT_186420 [Aspergillus tetrazonus]